MATTRGNKRRKVTSEAASRPICRHCGVKHRTITEDQCLDRSMPENTLQSRIVDRAKRRGWKVAHAGRGIAAFTAAGEPIFVTPMAKGWPDLFMLHERTGRALVIEVKKELGVFEDGQLEWLQAFNACGIPAVVCRPSDLREGRVNAILAGK
jgi:hypothetical protein